MFNELRAGYNQDRGNRKSQYDATSVATQMGLQVPSTAAGLRGFRRLLSRERHPFDC
jgi:hypothetical protein